MSVLSGIASLFFDQPEATTVQVCHTLNCELENKPQPGVYNEQEKKYFCKVCTEALLPEKSAVPPARLRVGRLIGMGVGLAMLAATGIYFLPATPPQITGPFEARAEVGKPGKLELHVTGRSVDIKVGGMPKNWTFDPSTRKITYTFGFPGEMKLMVEASNKAGKDSHEFILTGYAVTTVPAPQIATTMPVVIKPGQIVEVQAGTPFDYTVQVENTPSQWVVDKSDPPLPQTADLKLDAGVFHGKFVEPLAQKEYKVTVTAFNVAKVPTTEFVTIVVKSTNDLIQPLILPKEFNKAVVFVGNRLGDKYNDKMLPFQDLVVAEGNKAGFSCVTLENGVNSVTASDLDAVLKNGSSRLNLVRNMNAEYFLAANMTSYDEATVEKNVYNVKVSQTTYTLTLTYQIVDNNLGGTLDSGTVTVTKDIPKTAALSTSSDPFNSLLRDGAVQLAAKFAKNLPRPAPSGTARFSVDVRVQSFDIPNIVRNDKGEYVVSSEKFHLLANKATVLLDGAAIGTTPCIFHATPGLHKVHVTRDGCRDWEQPVMIKEGSEYVIDLQLSDDSIGRWKQMGAFLGELKNNEKITDAKAEVLKGYAQMLRQSGFKVDVKVDAKDPKSINMLNGALWSNPG